MPPPKAPHVAPPPAPPPLPETPRLLFGFIDPKTSILALVLAIVPLIVWGFGIDARAKESERTNIAQERRLEAVEAAVKTLALQTYQQEQMSKQLGEMARQIDDLRRVPAAIEVLSFRMGNVETAVGATPRRQQK